jgi:hypothetical protein
MRLLKQDVNKPAKLLLETEQGTGNGALLSTDIDFAPKI